MCSIHANSALDAHVKLATLPQLAGHDMDSGFVVPTVASAIDLVVHCETVKGGQRRATEIVAPTGVVVDGVIEADTLFRMLESSIAPNGMLPAPVERFTARASTEHPRCPPARPPHRLRRAGRSVAAPRAPRPAGQPIPAALAELRDDLALPSVGRLIDQVLAALDRGTPLAEVLRAHALDARDESKRRLLEAAGTREVAMLVPLVFLILPVTVLFAVYPGLLVLQLGF